VFSSDLCLYLGAISLSYLTEVKDVTKKFTV
jgi:hypothetical protein